MSLGRSTARPRVSHTTGIRTGGPPELRNRLVTIDSTAASYAYDGAGLRVKRTTGSNVRTIIFSGTKPIAEYLGTSLRREYIYAASQLLVRLDTSGGTTTTTYSHPDHLSARLETNTSGVVTRNFGHLPFGDIWYETGTIEKFKFTSYERDTESQLDYATFRFDSSRLGRFMSPDPVAGSTGDPQSLNRYAYVANDPINLIDPLGLCFTTDAAGICPLLDWGFGNASMGGGGGVFGCMLDGFSTPCSLVAGALSSGAAVNCPQCEPGDRVDSQGFIHGSMTFFVGEDMDHLDEVSEDVILAKLGDSLLPFAQTIPVSQFQQGEAQAATTYCQEHGQLSFNIPFTKIPVTISGSATFAFLNYSSTNDLSAVISTLPPFASFGAGLDMTVNAPVSPTPSVNIGAGRNLSAGTFLTPNGPKGLILSVGPSIGPPVSVSLPVSNLCQFRAERR